MHALRMRCTCGALLPSRVTSPRKSAASRAVQAADATTQTPLSSIPRRTRQLPSFAELAAHQSETPFQKSRKQKRQSLLLYGLSGAIGFLGIAYAAVPLYRMFCSATGYGGAPRVNPSGTHEGQFAPDRLTAATGKRARALTVRFYTDCSDALPWKFKASQTTVSVVPGETALAFFTAHNTSDKDIIGVATYSVMPAQIAPYFAKVECFCFDEQRLLAGEEVDLPVLFFIDRDFLDDPLMKDVTEVVLNYTFFRAKRNDQGILVPDGDPLLGAALSQGLSLGATTA